MSSDQATRPTDPQAIHPVHQRFIKACGQIGLQWVPHRASDGRTVPAVISKTTQTVLGKIPIACHWETANPTDGTLAIFPDQGDSPSLATNAPATGKPKQQAVPTTK